MLCSMRNVLIAATQLNGKPHCAIPDFSSISELSVEIIRQNSLTQNFVGPY